MSTPPYLYFATSQKPSVVHHVCVGAFTSKSAMNVIVASTTRIEVHVVTREGLSPVADIGLFARVATMQLCSAPGAGGAGRTQQLVITTERLHFMVLEWDEVAGVIKTVASGDMRVRKSTAIKGSKK